MSTSKYNGSSEWSTLNSSASGSINSSAELGPKNVLSSQFITMSGPYMKILEQPQSHVRFRYDTEGDHGYLCGKNTTKALATYPKVQLVNYKGAAHIRCELYQWDKEEKHPHQLKFHRQENQIEYLVPINGSYVVHFEKLRIISKRKASYSKEQRAQYLEANPGARQIDVNKYCKRKIDFNKVRLRFSAHDVQTGKEICHVYSTLILDALHCETNQPRIVRASTASGPACGKNEMILLVEKISNKYTKVRFREAKGDWSAIARPVCMHHQFAIVCSIPPYKNEKIAANVDAFIELVRESDGATSNAIPFKYIGRPHFALRGKRRYSLARDISTKNMMESSVQNKKWTPQVCVVPISQQCWSSNSQIPMAETLEQPTLQNVEKADSIGQNSDTDSGIQENYLPTYSDEDIVNLLIEDSQCDDLMQCPSTAFLPEEIRIPEDLVEEDFPFILGKNPVLSEAGQVPSLTAHPSVTQSGEVQTFNEFYQNLDRHEYFGPGYVNDALPFQKLIPDSAQKRDFEFDKTRFQSMRPTVKERSEMPQRHHTTGKILEMEKVEKIVQDIMILVKKNGPKSDLQTKLTALFELDLPNGDTFLHMTLNRRIFPLLVKSLHAVNMAYVLNEANDLYQTVLHLAVLNEMTEAVRMLVSKGCVPMLADANGNSAIHLAVTSLPTLAALFDAMAVNKVPYNVNATNYEDLTALHVASIHGCVPSLRLLLKHGADVTARDTWGRTALHLAASHDKARALSVLLDYVDAGDVDATDCRGQTALQTACDSDDVTKNTLVIIQLLLNAKADPTKRAGSTASAMKLARRHPEMRHIILLYQRKARLDESDDEYYTAEEEVILVHGSDNHDLQASLRSKCAGIVIRIRGRSLLPIFQFPGPLVVLYVRHLQKEMKWRAKTASHPTHTVFK